ncbi:hypothetical protein BLX42_10635 [Pseudomonas sp. SG-MS2]|uniref:hypothetical protein n=1 Tax=Pseudomonas TaxID=286 RepID=UPI000CFCA761|nr:MULTISPECIES: hypothetical protein [unclassified Pseudomonas]KAF1311044.1 hypothetical protein BLX42_10635 [Pseudomonas sp. SG-MS2]PRA59409.1 hypothetical protein CQ065_22060 [Pseudomonas sp. MYb187]
MKLAGEAATALLGAEIDATAALDSALKREPLHAMAGVLEPSVNVAMQTSPELKLSREIWQEVVSECDAARLAEDRYGNNPSGG